RLVDPENRLLGHAHRRRLGFEEMRDSVLAASGELDRTQGGRASPLDAKSPSRRRTIYGFIDRLNVPGVFRTFDFPNPDAHSPERFTTTVPQQALFLMNSPFLLERSRHLAERSEILAERDPEARIRAFYRTLYGRPPKAEEMAIGLDLVRSPESPPTVAAQLSSWKYGFGEFDDALGRLKEFHPLPHFSGSTWQGGPEWPDPTLGWVMLSSAGGHAGNDSAHAAVRRWIAPRDGLLTVVGTVVHKYKEGNGVRARIVSSRAGELGSWIAHDREVEVKIKGIEAKAGDTIDFIADCRGDVLNDEFLWAPIIQMTVPPGAAGGGGAAVSEWNAAKEFQGPPPPPLGPWERYAQVLLLSNEFIFLD
ncbi:MAG TPA: DUF1553 domain-containing protein, partial [Planctomycetota bacterium]|nr:DUF1553 domain-containing protein [Planctomycetota bacterium]